MKKGTIFILDISGYSRFVRDTDIEMGAYVTSTLLQSMIESNRLFKVNEIEGDAILFYKIGEHYPVQILLQQIDEMLQAFNITKRSLAYLHPLISQLTLKSIIHFGDITEFSVNSYTKLYGPTLVEAHRLLKNSIQHNCYTLITDDYLRAVDNYTESFHHQSESYDIGNISYGFICYLGESVIAA